MSQFHYLIWLFLKTLHTLKIIPKVVPSLLGNVGGVPHLQTSHFDPQSWSHRVPPQPQWFCKRFQHQIWLSASKSSVERPQVMGFPYWKWTLLRSGTSHFCNMARNKQRWCWSCKFFNGITRSYKFFNGDRISVICSIAEKKTAAVNRPVICHLTLW